MYAQVFRLQQAGKAEAVELCTGSGANHANGAFRRFDESLGQTLDVNERAFGEAVKQGFSALSGFDMTASLAAIIIAGLCILGVWQRLREYF
jgi:hypothetical protein